jgi:hypothetical protein
MTMQLSIHGRDKSGKQSTQRYNAGGIENEAIPTTVGDKTFNSKRAAARASREAGNTGGPSCSKRR